MYTLTLTRDERRAIDWIGGRYGHGFDLGVILTNTLYTPDDLEWDEEGDITYHLIESQAWEVSELIDADNLACFSDEFRSKLYQFQAKIV